MVETSEVVTDGLVVEGDCAAGGVDGAGERESSTGPSVRAACRGLGLRAAPIETDGAGEAGGELANPEARIGEDAVVAELAIVEADGAGDDVLEAGEGTKREHQAAEISRGWTPHSLEL